MSKDSSATYYQKKKQLVEGIKMFLKKKNKK